MAFTILFRLSAVAAKMPSSVTHRMPCFLIFDIMCFRFKTEKLPSLHIFRLRIIEYAAALEDALARQREEYEVVDGLLRKLIAENAHKVMDQEEYSCRETALQEHYEATQREIASLEKQRNERKVHREQLNAFPDMVEEHHNLLKEFDEHLWRMTVEAVTIYSK